MLNEKQNEERFIIQPDDLTFLDVNGQPITGDVNEYLRRKKETYDSRPKIKFLEVGKVVKVKGINFPIIISTLHNKFNGVMYNYVGYKFENNQICKDEVFPFNHTDIEGPYELTDLELMIETELKKKI